MARIKESSLPALKASLKELGLREDDFTVLGKEGGMLVIESGRSSLDDSRLQAMADAAATKTVAPPFDRQARKRELVAKASWSTAERDEAIRLMLEDSIG